MKTYIIVDNNNSVTGISEDVKIEMENCITHEINEILDHSKIDGFIFKDGQISFDEEKFEARQLENKQWELRNKREELCFAILNRNSLWYNKYVTTKERELELANWYQAWLDVTETLVEPKTPEWIE